MTGNLGIIASGVSSSPPTLRSTSTLRTAAATGTSDPGKPSGTASSDLLLAQVAMASTADTCSAPAGWSAVTGATNPTDTTGGATVRGYLFQAAGSVASTTFTKTGTNGVMRITILAIAGASAVDVAAVSSSAANSTVVSYPDITTTVNNCLLLELLDYNNTSAAAVNAPFTEQYENTSVAGPSQEGSTAPQTTAGASNGNTGSLGTSGGQVRWQIGVKP